MTKKINYKNKIIELVIELDNRHKYLEKEYEDLSLEFWDLDREFKGNSIFKINRNNIINERMEEILEEERISFIKRRQLIEVLQIIKEKMK